MQTIGNILHISLKKARVKTLPTATSSGDDQNYSILKPGSAWFQAEVRVSCFAQVYQTCGTPGETTTGSPALQEPRKKSSLTATEYKPSPTAGARLAMQV